MPPIGKTKTPQQQFHYRCFEEFTRYEIASGGPDPHLKMASALALEDEDPLWCAGCYTSSYVVATNYVITSRFSRRDVLKDPSKLKKFIVDNWEFLPIRKERRVNGTGPEKLAEIIYEYGKWLDAGGVDALEGLSYEETFKAVNPPHHGRYFKTKIYEVLRLTLDKMGGFSLPEMEDIVPKGGAHPRKAFLNFFATHSHKSDKSEDLSEANRYASELKSHLFTKGLSVGWFTLEVLLCNYRQAVAGGQYPGRAHDSELGHCKTVAKKFNVSARRVLECRSEMFEPKFLGEVDDKWEGRRLELGKVMMKHGYVWTDTLYNYRSTTDLSSPEKW